MKMLSLQGMFKPRSVMVVGISNKPENLGYTVLLSLREFGFPGKVYLVNPRLTEILGLKVHNSLEEISETVDLAVICTSAEKVPSILQKIVDERKARWVVVYAAGFGELRTEEGLTLEEEIRRIIYGSEVHVVGPNCIGVYSFPGKINTLTGARDTYKLISELSGEGNVGFISQSGWFTIQFMSACVLRGVYLNKAVSTGNETDLTTTDFMECFAEDPEIRVISSYLEGVKDGRKFIETLKKTTLKKPVIIWKVGKTNVGKEAVKSHTGSLAGSAEIYDAVFRQFGVVSAEGNEDLIDYTVTFATCKSFLGKGRVGIVSGPGGFAVATAEACEKFGLKIPKLSSQTVEKLRKVLPKFAGGLLNPVDLTMRVGMEPELYRNALEVVAEDENVDLLIVVGNPPIYQTIKDLVKNLEKPVFAVLGYFKDFFEETKKLVKIGVPTYPSPEKAVKSIKALLNYQTYLEKKNVGSGAWI